MNPLNAGQAKAGTSLRLTLCDGLLIEVPPSLSAITTYVLLEQEAWFEKEVGFLRHFLKPGMTAIDVGANLGVYSLPMARLVGPDGRVFAYEPGGEARALLEKSRSENRLANLEIAGSAVSDGAREGYLAAASSTELRALSAADSGEPVHITSLDIEYAAHGWTSIDFVKIDAEGEEERILAGAKSFFAAHSPLVMFEIKAGDAVNERLRDLFPALGYRTFRQLGGAPILVPDDRTTQLDRFELNLFAAKADRAQALAQQGLLVETIPDWTPGTTDYADAASFWQAQAFATLVPPRADGLLSGDADYQNALTGYAAWRATGRTTAVRCAALAFALKSIRAACALACTAERASTWARIAAEWGERTESCGALNRLKRLINNVSFQEPFLPAAPRFDGIPVGPRPVEWFAAATAEQLEHALSFSSMFSGLSSVLPWICSHPFATAEMERRRVLIAARRGARPKVPPRLCEPAPDHLNAEIWRSGMVPGTVP